MENNYNNKPKLRCAVVYGAGGHARVVIDILKANDLYNALYLLDDDEKLWGSVINQCKVIGGMKKIDQFKNGCTDGFVIGVGDNIIRERLAREMFFKGLKAVCAIHPNSIISPSVTFGLGTVVMAGVVVNVGTVIGDHAILNTSCCVDHDCVIGDLAHISPMATLCGGVKVGPYVHIGAAATVLPGCNIGEKSVVGAGSVVLKDVPANTVVAGSPARFLRNVSSGE